MEKLNIKNKIASFLFKIGLSADAATVLGLVFAAVSGWFALKGEFFLAGSFLLISGGLDLMDGAIARLSGKAGTFGGILDSSLDRYGDGFIFGGILFYCALHQKFFYAGLAFSALLGSFAISYIRARAECETENCRVGFWERGERIVYTALGLLLNNMGLVLLALGTLTHMTAFYRLYHSKSGFKFINASGRKNRLYAAQVIFFAALVVFVRPVF